MSAVSRSIVHVKRKRKDADPLRSAWHILEDWLEVNRRRIVTIGAIAAGLVLLVAVLYYVFEYRAEQQQRAFAEAFEKFTATVGAAPAVPGMPGAPAKTYATKEEKFADAAKAFEQLADDYSAFDDVGRYYAGLSYLEIEPAKGVSLLEGVASSDAEITREAQLALGEYFLRSGEDARAEQQFEKLSNDPGNLPRFYILNRLAAAKERAGKPTEAAALYKQVVDADRNSEFGVEAEKGLQRVDPAAAAALPPKTPASGSPSFTQQGGRAGAPAVPGLPPGLGLGN
jgi:tetratricopeptide (TPR) repeat protein